VRNFFNHTPVSFKAFKDNPKIKTSYFYPMVPWKQKAPVLYQLSEFIRSAGIRIDEATLHQAARVAADTIGVAFSGVKTEAFRYALEQKDLLFGNGIFPVWSTGITTTLTGAAFYNALSVSSTDFDEGHRQAVGHPASAIVPAAFALGALLNSKIEDVLKSLIIGYEIATRFSHARIAEKIDTYSTGRWGAVGTAAAAAYLLKLNTAQIMHALSNAWVLSPVMLGGSTDVSTGSMSKEGVAWATQSGLQSTLMAQKDFVGPYLFVDDHDDLDREKLLAGLGNGWLINTNYFKPFACCRWLHAGVEAAARIREKHHVVPENITDIEISTFGRAINLVGGKFPQNPVQAQFHLPYVVACMFLNGLVLPEYFTGEWLQNTRIKTLIELTTLRENENYNKVFPAELPTKITVKTQKGKFTGEVISTPWEASQPPSDEELKEKFIRQTGKEYEALWETLITAENKSVNDLIF
jgi:2-methylcitrate dehydratase PrpD